MNHEAMVYFVDEESAEQTKAMFADTDSKTEFPLPNYRKRKSLLSIQLKKQAKISASFS